MKILMCWLSVAILALAGLKFTTSSAQPALPQATLAHPPLRLIVCNTVGVLTGQVWRWSIDHDGDGYSACTGDCDDGDPTRHPGSPEWCDDVDNNCDGRVDEYFTASCVCQPLACQEGSPHDSDGNGCDDTCLVIDDPGPEVCPSPPATCPPGQYLGELNGCETCLPLGHTCNLRCEYLVPPNTCVPLDPPPPGCP